MGERASPLLSILGGFWRQFSLQPGLGVSDKGARLGEKGPSHAMSGRVVLFDVGCSKAALQSLASGGAG